MRKALLDANNVLVEHGFCQYTGMSVAVPDNFNLEPKAWKWDGSQFVSYTAPAPTDAERMADAMALVNGNKRMLAMVVWLAQKLSIPTETAKQEIATIYKDL